MCERAIEGFTRGAYQLWLGAGDRDGLDGLLSRLRAADPSVYPAAEAVVAPLAQGLWAFAAGDWETAAGLLAPIAQYMVRLGVKPLIIAPGAKLPRRHAP